MADNITTGIGGSKTGTGLSSGPGNGGFTGTRLQARHSYGPGANRAGVCG